MAGPLTINPVIGGRIFKSLPDSVMVTNYVWVNSDAVNLPIARNTLTVMPRATSEYSVPQPIRCYAEVNGLFGFPRHFFYKMATTLGLRNIKWSENVATGGMCNVEFGQGFAYRPGQEEAVRRVVEYLQKSGEWGAIVCCPCAFGKTVVGLGIIKELGMRALVTVHTEALLHQWQDKIREFMPGARVGVIQGDRCEIEDRDIVIGMIESLAFRDYPSGVYRAFGVVVSDEIHRLGAPTWSYAVPKFACRYRIGLSATPRRSDRSEMVFIWHTGPVMKFGFEESDLSLTVRRVYTEWQWTGKVYSSGWMIKRLTMSEERNRLIATELVKAVKAGRWVFVVSDRLAHLQKLAQYFRQMCEKDGLGAVRYDFFVGGRTKEEYERAKDAQVLFATIQYAGEGVDSPRHDTLFLCTPKVTPVRQLVGRIMRKMDGKKPPLFVDFVDYRFQPFKEMAEARHHLLAKSFNVKKGGYDGDNKEKESLACQAGRQEQ